MVITLVINDDSFCWQTIIHFFFFCLKNKSSHCEPHYRLNLNDVPFVAGKVATSPSESSPCPHLVLFSTPSSIVAVRGRQPLGPSQRAVGFVPSEAPPAWAVQQPCPRQWQKCCPPGRDKPPPFGRSLRLCLFHRWGAGGASAGAARGAQGDELVSTFSID